ncbi:hypothetical protein PENSPDRAFT_675021 [Peniophora sp. CONT]|nr:hypothetical protein PENSPDRAFT_675021 [Peniophora sp. CONT]
MAETIVQKDRARPYPLIDSDPHFFRVVRYMRLSDYATWGLTAAAAPGALYLWNIADRVPLPAHYFKQHYRLGGVLGLAGGFILAYQRSSFRFWGWSENSREVDADLQEMSAKVARGEKPYGESGNPDWVQAAAHRNSVNSQMKLQTIPMFNLVNHPHHGVDVAKYGAKKEDDQ